MDFFINILNNLDNNSNKNIPDSVAEQGKNFNTNNNNMMFKSKILTANTFDNVGSNIRENFSESAFQRKIMDNYKEKCRGSADSVTATMYGAWLSGGTPIPNIKGVPYNKDKRCTWIFLIQRDNYLKMVSGEFNELGILIVTIKGYKVNYAANNFNLDEDYIRSNYTEALTNAEGNKWSIVIGNSSSLPYFIKDVKVTGFKTISEEEEEQRLNREIDKVSSEKKEIVNLENELKERKLLKKEITNLQVDLQKREQKNKYLEKNYVLTKDLETQCPYGYPYAIKNGSECCSELESNCDVKASAVTGDFEGWASDGGQKNVNGVQIITDKCDWVFAVNHHPYFKIVGGEISKDGKKLIVRAKGFIATNLPLTPSNLAMYWKSLISEKNSLKVNRVSNTSTGYIVNNINVVGLTSGSNCSVLNTYKCPGPTCVDNIAVKNTGLLEKKYDNITNGFSENILSVESNIKNENEKNRNVLANIEVLNERVSDMDNEISDLNSQISHYKKLDGTDEAKILKLRQEINAEKQEISKLKTTLKQKENILKTTLGVDDIEREEILQLQNKIKKLDEKIKREQHELSKLDKEDRMDIDRLNSWEKMLKDEINKNQILMDREKKSEDSLKRVKQLVNRGEQSKQMHKNLTDSYYGSRQDTIITDKKAKKLAEKFTVNENTKNLEDVNAMERDSKLKLTSNQYHYILWILIIVFLSILTAHFTIVKNNNIVNVIICLILIGVFLLSIKYLYDYI